MERRDAAILAGLAPPDAAAKAWRRDQAAVARWAAPPAARRAQVVSVPFARQREAFQPLDRPATVPEVRPNGRQARLVQMLRAPVRAPACHLAEAGADRRELVPVWDPWAWV